MANKTLTLRLPEYYSIRLDDLSRKFKRSKADLIKEALNMLFEKYGVK